MLALNVHSSSDDQDLKVDSAMSFTAPLSSRINRRSLRIASVCIPCVEKPAYAPGLKNVSFEPEPPDDAKRLQTLSEKDQLVNSFRESYLQLQSKDLDIVGHVVQTANFAAAYLDSRGGFLSVDQCDVNLYVPPGALSNENDPKLVYIYVTASAANGCVTPSVHCGPSDLDFMKDVILTIPHCAKDAHLCQFTCSKKSSNKLSQIQDRENGSVLVDSKSLLTVTNHFTAVAASSDPKEKIARYMTAGVFWNGSTHKREVRVRLRLFQSTKAHLQEVEQEEKRFDFVRVEPWSKLGIYFPGGDVVVKLTSRENTWKLQDGGANLECCTKMICSATLCETGVNNQDDVPSGSNVLFFAAGDATSTTSFEANMEVYQKGKEHDRLDFFVHKSKTSFLCRGRSCQCSEETRTLPDKTDIRGPLNNFIGRSIEASI